VPSVVTTKDKGLVTTRPLSHPGVTKKDSRKEGRGLCNIQGSTTEAAEGLPMHATLHKIGPLRRARGEKSATAYLSYATRASSDTMNEGGKPGVT
jgi:hypothetical protein